MKAEIFFSFDPLKISYHKPVCTPTSESLKSIKKKVVLGAATGDALQSYVSPEYGNDCDDVHDEYTIYQQKKTHASRDII